MKKLKLIYNPFAGDKSFKNYLDDAITVFQNGGYETHAFRSSENGAIQAHIRDMEKGFYDGIAVSGGDGTLNIVLNALLKHGHDIPIGIIPSGTANDFASYLKIPNDVAEAASVITEGNIIYSDAGKINNIYFANVCGAGLLTNISSNIDNDFKNSLGKMAYYLTGIGQIPNFAPLPMRITNSKETFEEELYLFIVLNSSGTGGFENLSPDASITDGLFDFIAIKARPIVEIAVLFLKILRRDYLNDSNIIYFQDNYLKIEPLFDNEPFFETDIDGERGPLLPAEIHTVKSAFRLFAPKKTKHD